MAFLELYHKFDDMEPDDFAVLEFTLEESIQRGFYTEAWPDCELDHAKVDEFKATLVGLTHDEYYEMSNLETLKRKMLADPEVRAEYIRLGPEFELIARKLKK